MHTPAQAADHDLIVMGTLDDNRWIAELTTDLPVKFGRNHFEWRGETYDHPDDGLFLVVPNPFSELDMPLAMQYRFNNFSYFFVLLAGATLAYSWRTIFAMGTWTTGLWLGAMVRSFLVAVFSAALSMVIGVPAAFVLARQKLGGGLSDLADAEGVDEPLEADVAARLDGAHQVAGR